MADNRLCLVLKETTLRQNLENLKRQKDQIDLIELRADFLDPEEWNAVPNFPKRAKLPVIFTLRRTNDGGRFERPERVRRQLLRSASEAGFAFIDIEEDVSDPTLERRVRSKGGRIIRSLHDFSGLTDDLANRMRKMKRSPSDIPKAACLLGGTKDLVEILKVFQELRDEEKILTGMGTYGVLTRILAPILGSYLTYASDPNDPAAPGHLDPDTLQSIYRYRSLDRETRIYGVIGNPILHSLSPAIHNRGFSLHGLNSVYLPIQVDDIESFFEIAEILKISAASVTVPHKEAVLPYLQQRDETIDAVGACNTLLKRDSRWQGANTDVVGFLTPLRNEIAALAPADRLAVVVGAGGAARAAVFALKREGFSILIINRTRERARELAQAFNTHWAGLDSSGFRQAQAFSRLIVQATSVGMTPNVNNNPLRGYPFQGHELVYELIYTPPQTALMKAAKSAGCRVLGGMDMLISQAMVQFRLFTGQDYPAPEELRLTHLLPGFVDRSG